MMQSRFCVRVCGQIGYPLHLSLAIRFTRRNLHVPHAAIAAIRGNDRVLEHGEQSLIDERKRIPQMLGQ